jgi:hypothetical protein
MDKDVILCPASPRQRDEIRRCLPKLELPRFLNRRLHATNAKHVPNQNPLKIRTLMSPAIHEAIGSSRDFETITAPAEAAKLAILRKLTEKSDGLTPADLWRPACNIAPSRA